MWSWFARGCNGAVEVSFGEQMGTGHESFQVPARRDEPMHGLYAAVVGMSGGRDADVVAVSQDDTRQETRTFRGGPAAGRLPTWFFSLTS